MNRYILVLLTNIFISLIQTSFLHELLGPGLNFNLILAFSFSLLLLDEDELSMFSAFSGGLILDMLSFGFVGSYALVLTLALFISYLFKRYIFKSFVFQLVLTFVFSVLFKFFMIYMSNGDPLNIDLWILLSHIGVTLFAAGFYLLNAYVKERFLKHEYKLIK